MNPITLGNRLINLFYPCFELCVCDFFVFPVHDETKAGERLINISSSDSLGRVQGILELVEVNQIAFIDPNGVDTQVPAPFTIDFLHFRVSEAFEPKEVPVDQEISALLKTEPGF